VKRWRDGGGFEDDERELQMRAEAERAPLAVQSLAPKGHGRSLILPLAIGGVALLFVLATAGRYLDYFGAEQGTPATPAPPTPITWLDATASSRPAGPTASPGASLAPVVAVQADYQSYLLLPGAQIRFVVRLTNTSGRSVTLDPCPTYRTYVPGSSAREPERPLNCAAAPATFLQGESLSFEMLYTVPPDVGPGKQLLIWELTSGLRGNASITLSMDQPPSASPTTG
jgi:hypothetical protein